MDASECYSRIIRESHLAGTTMSTGCLWTRMGKSAPNDDVFTPLIKCFQPSIAQAYFSDPEKRSRTDIESSNASLRGTLKSLQVS